MAGTHDVVVEVIGAPAPEGDIEIRLIGPAGPWSVPRAYFEARKSSLPPALVARLERGERVELFPMEIERMLAAAPAAAEGDPWLELVATLRRLRAEGRRGCLRRLDPAVPALVAQFVLDARREFARQNWSRHGVQILEIVTAVAALDELGVEKRAAEARYVAGEEVIGLIGQHLLSLLGQRIEEFRAGAGK